MGAVATAIIAIGLMVSQPIETPSETQLEPLGEHEITAYSYSEGNGENYYTASGAIPKPYVTVAVDPKVIPYGTVLYVEGVGEVVAEDCGSAVKGKVIDLHIGYDNPEEWGRQNREVWIVN